MTEHQQAESGSHDDKQDIRPNAELGVSKRDVAASINCDTDTEKTNNIQIQDSGSSGVDKIATTTSSLHPFVHWAQSHTHISLRVDLSQVENLNIKVENGGNSLRFFAKGTGAQGLQDYSFSLDFLYQVDENFVTHAIERYVLILLQKSKRPSNWVRLTKQQARFPWLRFDFDRYAGDDSSDNEYENNSDEDLNDDKERSSQQRRKHSSNQEGGIESSNNQQVPSNSWAASLNNIFKKNDRNFNISNPFDKRKDSKTTTMKYDYRKETVVVDNSKNTARHAMDYKKTYLFLYNLVMFIMFLKVNLVLIIKGMHGTFDDDIVQGAAFIVKILTYTQLLESIHPILGLVPGGPMMPFLQVIGRLLVNHFLSEPSIRLDAGVYAPYLFIVWSSIEIFRYSFYALRIFRVNIHPLTWCRYSLFMPLYPCGGFCETMVICSTIKYYELTGDYSFSLPNSANISFSLPLFLRFYNIFLLWPSIIYLMRYMWFQRRKQLEYKEKTA